MEKCLLTNIPVEQSIAIAKGHRGKGIEKELALTGVREAEMTGIETVIVTVPSCAHFYTDYGYKVVETKDITPTTHVPGPEFEFLNPKLFPFKITFLLKRT